MLLAAPVAACTLPANGPRLAWPGRATATVPRSVPSSLPARYARFQSVSNHVSETALVTAASPPNAVAYSPSPGVGDP